MKSAAVESQLKTSIANSICSRIDATPLDYMEDIKLELSISFSMVFPVNVFESLPGNELNFNQMVSIVQTRFMTAEKKTNYTSWMGFNFFEVLHVSEKWQYSARFSGVSCKQFTRHPVCIHQGVQERGAVEEKTSQRSHGHRVVKTCVLKTSRDALRTHLRLAFFTRRDAIG